MNSTSVSQNVSLYTELNVRAITLCISGSCSWQSKSAFAASKTLAFGDPVAIVSLTIADCSMAHSCYLAKSELCACAMQGTRDPLFLTGVTFPPDYPIYEETKIKLTVYDVKDKSQDTVGTLLLLLLKYAQQYD